MTGYARLGYLLHAPGQRGPRTPENKQPARSVRGEETQMNDADGLLMKYFVLKPKGKDVFARASRRAMRAYAGMIAEENETFANELRAWADKEFDAAVADGMIEELELP